MKPLGQKQKNLSKALEKYIHVVDRLNNVSLLQGSTNEMQAWATVLLEIRKISDVEDQKDNESSKKKRR